MHGRAEQRFHRQDEAFRSQMMPDSAASASPADRLAKLADLRDRGTIAADEFEREKAKVLA